MSKHHRKKYVIDRKIQGAIARRVALQWIMFVMLAFLVLPFWQSLLSGDPILPGEGQLQRQMFANAPAFVILLSLLPAFVWDMLKLTNRFSGPVYRFRKSLHALGAGEAVEPIRFRKGDFWQGMADDFNAVLIRVNSKEGSTLREPDIPRVSQQNQTQSQCDLTETAAMSR
jgi:hypothetical protein